MIISKIHCFVLIFVCTFIPNLLFAEGTPKQDSLLKVWNNSSLQDTVRLQAMEVLISKYYLGINPDSAKYYSEIMYEFARINDNTTYQGLALLQKGHAFLFLGSYSNAHEQYSKAFTLFEEIGYLPGLAKAYNALGATNKYDGKLDLALEQLEKGIQIIYELGDSAKTPSILINMASIFEAQGDIRKSLEYNLLALEICTKYKKRNNEGISRNNLGNNYKYLGDVRSASEQYRKAMEIYEELELPWGQINVLNNLGLLFMDDQDFSKALDFSEKALLLSEQNNLLEGQAMSHSNLGSVYTHQEKYAEALASYQKSLKLVEENGMTLMIPYLQQEIGQVFFLMDKLDKAENYLNKGLQNNLKNEREEDVASCNLYLSRLYEKKGNWLKAQNSGEHGLSVAKRMGYVQLTSDLASQLVNIYKQLNKNAQAFEMLELHVQLKDSLYNEENTRALIYQDFQYNFDKKAFQDSLANANLMAVKQAEIKRQKLATNYLLGFLFLAIIFGIVLINRYRVIRQQKRLIQIEKEKSEAANDKLQEIDQSKSRFFTNISHEFRTPLTVIAGMTEHIKENDRAKKLIQQNTKHLLLLINQILDLRKLESGKQQVNFIQADIVHYFKYIIESFRSLAKDRKIDLIFQSEEEILLLDFDPEKLLRIVSNLISNALKFTEKGGEVVFEIEAQAEEPKPYYQFQIIDTGLGIPSEKLAHIFDQFYRVDDSITSNRTGTGIGLTLTKELVQLLNGNIQVKSNVGKGTRFIVQLPITNEASIELDLSYVPVTEVVSLESDYNTYPVTKTTAESKGDFSSVSPHLTDKDLPILLLVEDNPSIMQYLIASLESQYQLLFASNGREGIDIAIEMVPEIIISDVMMPEVDGLTLCSSLKKDERTSHIPIILLTAKADFESRILGLERGADAYIAKPFNHKELEVELKNSLAIRQRMQDRYADLKSFAPSEDIGILQEDKFIIKIRKIIEEHMKEDGFGVTELCKEISMSRTQLHHKIKSLIGKPTTHLIRSIRIGKAKELLQQTTMNISEISFEVGIDSLSYFSRTFTAETGFSPLKYREKLKSEQ